MTQLADLNDHCLLSLLDRLPPHELFKMQRVSRRFKRLVAEKLRTVKAISLNEADDHFSLCSHLKTCQTTSNQVLVLGPMLINWIGFGFGCEMNRSRRWLVLRLISKCPNVECIDVTRCKLPGYLLVKMINRCPKIKCIKLSQKTYVKDEEWDELLTRVGPQLVHFTMKWTNPKFQDFSYHFESGPPNWVYSSAEKLLKIIVEKCPNIKRLDWRMEWDFSLTDEMRTAWRLLPKSCWVTTRVREIGYNVTFEDNVDELDVGILRWSKFNSPVERLSSLKCLHLELGWDGWKNQNIALYRGVKFTGLKKLDLSDCYLRHLPPFREYDRRVIDFLVASQYPVLEELSLCFRSDMTEEQYDRLFEAMATIKKLTIVFKVFGEMPKLPESVIQLNHLKEIQLEVKEIPSNWQMKDFFKQVGRCVDAVESLKKVTVVLVDDDVWFSIWHQVVRDKVERINEEQNRKVEVVFKM